MRGQFGRRGGRPIEAVGNIVRVPVGEVQMEACIFSL